MGELIPHLSLGFSVALTPANLGLCLLGTLLGTAVGVLPGIGAVATVAMLLPVTFGLPPAGSLIMLAGIYYGAQYGGSTTAILLNLPGEPTSVATALDGHALAREGRAGPALAIAAIGSFVAGSAATLLIAGLAVPLASVALLVGPVEYVALMLLGLLLAVSLSRGSLLKGLAAVLAGLLLSTIGTDLETGTARMILGLPALEEGLSFVSLAMGLFGFAEIIRTLSEPRSAAAISPPRLMPDRRDLAATAPAIGRGTAVGALLGILPGGGALIASFAAYALEAHFARGDSPFGGGRLSRVAAAESANNAAAQTSFIPLLSLGIPASAMMALMLGALVLHGITPGPRLVAEQPELFWALVASMWIGNLMLLVLNLPLIGLWVRLLRVPYRWLYPAILVFGCVGIFAVRGSTFDIAVAAVFGLVGCWMSRHELEPGPLLLAFAIGPLLEDNLRRAVIVARGDIGYLAGQPLSLLLLGAAVVLLLGAGARAVDRRGR